MDVARRADEARAAAGLKARTIPQPTHGQLTRAYSAARTSGVGQRTLTAMPGPTPGK